MNNELESPEQRRIRLETADSEDLTDTELLEDICNLLDDAASVIREESEKLEPEPTP